MDASRVGTHALFSTERIRAASIARPGGAARGALVAVLVPLTLIWLALAPYTVHDLATSPFFVPMTWLAYAYLVVYAIAVLLIVGELRQSLGQALSRLDWPAPLGLASLAPLLALLAGAAHWLQPRVAEVMSRWYVSIVDAVFVAVALWTIYELGWRDNDFAAQ